MKINKRAGLAAAAFVAVGAGVLGGAAIAAASDNGASGAADRPGYGTYGGPGRSDPHEHTEVTGDELAQVTDAVTAYDATITVDMVLQDPDGSYDVLATKDGAPVMLEVSADLATVTARVGGPGVGGHGAPGGPGGPGGPGDGDHDGRGYGGPGPDGLPPGGEAPSGTPGAVPDTAASST